MQAAGCRQGKGWAPHLAGVIEALAVGICDEDINCLHHSLVVVKGILDRGDVGEQGLIWRAGNGAEEVLEVLVARWAAHKEDASRLYLHTTYLGLNGMS